MTEQEILIELASNDAKIIRALVEKSSQGTDDARLTSYNERQDYLRELLRQLRG